MAHLALVIGGGIGGLTAAIALERAGLQVRVFESAPTIRAVGAGITVQANAMSALGAIGMADAVRERGHVFEHGMIGDMWGRRLASYSFGPIHAALPHPSVGIARPLLLRALRDGVSDGVVATNMRCVGYGAEEERVVARFEDGSEVVGDILVGADGIHSAVRAQLLGDQPTRYSGYTCWRGVVPIGSLWDPTLFGEKWGRGTRFGLVPLAEGQLYWFAVANAPQGVRHDEPKQACVLKFADWSDDVRKIIATTPAEAVLHHDIVDRAPMDVWGSGRVTLLGDAAHAMTPNMGQGACMAIEDCIVLANRLGGATDPAPALRAYEDARRGRANAIIRQSWMIGSIGQLSNPLLCLLRDWGTWLTPQWVITGEMKKLWDWSDL